MRASQLLTNLYTEAKNATLKENLKETSVSSLIEDAFTQYGIDHQEIIMAPDQQDFMFTIDVSTFSLIFGGVVLHMQQKDQKLPIKLNYECSTHAEKDSLRIILHSERIV